MGKGIVLTSALHYFNQHFAKGVDCSDCNSTDIQQVAKLYGVDWRDLWNAFTAQFGVEPEFI